MICERIKALRESFNYTQVGLGRILGVTKQTVSNWENDNILPSVEMLMKIAKVFGVSTDYLLGLDSREHLEITGLSPEQRAHIQLLIDDILA